MLQAEDLQLATKILKHKANDNKRRVSSVHSYITEVMVFQLYKNIILIRTGERSKGWGTAHTCTCKKM